MKKGQSAPILTTPRQTVTYNIDYIVKSDKLNPCFICLELIMFANSVP
jgi:hypothetical protein